jgi:FkbM family methyltransferase
MQRIQLVKFVEKCRKLVSILCSTPYRRALWMGAAAAVEHGPVLRGLCCKTVVDIGANRGQFALVAHRYFPEAAIISFEPLPGAAQIFRRVLGNENLVILQQLAIGPKPLNCEMHVSRRDDSSSLLPIGALHAQIFPGTAECGQQLVRVEPLNSILSATDIRSRALLKIDVEGYEIEVLKSCGALLDLFTYVYLEASFVELNQGQPLADEVIEYLKCSGFQLKGVFNVTYDKYGHAVQADFMFINTKPKISIC